MATISSLTRETLSHILELACDYPTFQLNIDPWTGHATRNAELKKCALVCSTCRNVALPLLYWIVSLDTEASAKAFREGRSKSQFWTRDVELI